MNTWDIGRDAFYIVIYIKDDDIVFGVGRVDKDGRYNYADIVPCYYINYSNRDTARDVLVNEIIPFFRKMVDDENDDTFDYYRTDLHKNRIMMMTPHTTDIGCRGSIVELLLFLIENKIFSISNVLDFMDN